MIAVARSSMAIMIGLLVSIACAADPCATNKCSTPEVKTRANTTEGTITFTYKTYLAGPAGLQVPWLWGKIEIEDKDEYGPPAPGTRTPVIAATDWAKGGDQEVRIALEFGLAGKEAEFREQVRFIRHLGQSSFAPVQNIKDFDGAGGKALHDYVYAFCALEEDNTALTKGSANGYTILNQDLNVAEKKISIEFIRPFDVSYDHTFHLEAGELYKLYITYGVFDGPLDITQWRVKGMRARLVDNPPTAPAYDQGTNWLITSPPGWSKILKEQEKWRKKNAVHTTVSLLAAFLLAALTTY